MTGFAAQHVARTTGSHPQQSGAQRLLRSLTSVGAIVLDSIDAARGMGSAHTSAARRDVLDRFAADTTRDARSAA
jgi:hypothetical protein